jgi:Polyketide cyclase / dehydrase and lipid transport
MASIRREIALNQTADRVWDALRDFHAVDRRVAPGFVTRAEPDGTARMITFANGTTAKEELVDCDEAAQRLVYAISNERLKHYNAAVQLFADGHGHCRLVWTVDLLPNELANYVGQQMDAAVKVMKPTLEGAA